MCYVPWAFSRNAFDVFFLLSYCHSSPSSWRHFQSGFFHWPQFIRLVYCTWKTLPQNQPNSDKHQVSVCPFQWLKGGVALVNLSLSCTWTHGTPDGWVVLKSVRRRKCSTPLVCQVATPIWALGRTHWLTDWLPGWLALLPQLAEPPFPASQNFGWFFFSSVILCVSLSACCPSACKCGPRYASVISLWKSSALVASYSSALVTGHW